MKLLTMLAAGVAALAMTAPAAAAPLVVSFAGNFTGTFANEPFSTFATFTGLSNTDDVLFYGNELFAPLSSLSTTLGGNTYNVTTPAIFFLGLLTPDTGGTALIFDLANSGPGNYFGGNFRLTGPDFTSTQSLPFSLYNATLNTSGGVAEITGGSGLTFSFALSAVPEPATWAMMIVGFGLVGAAMRRRDVTVRYA